MWREECDPRPYPGRSVGANIHRPAGYIGRSDPNVSGAGQHRACRLRDAGWLPSGAVTSLFVAVLASVTEEDDISLFLGEDLIVWLVLAFGGALLAGNLAAVLRPPQRATRKEGDLDQAPVARSLVMAGIGLVATIWALVSLLA